MRPDLLSHRPGKVIVRASVAAIVLVSLAALAFAVVTTISTNATAARATIYANRLTSRTVSGVDDLTALFREQQTLFLRIMPPAKDFVLRQPCGTIPFDPNGFPDDFLNGLVAETNKGCLVYTVVIAEDPVTRETVLANAKGYEIHAVPAAADYDPWWFLNSVYPGLDSGSYDSDQIAWLKACYDPAHVQITVTLLPAVSISTYAAAMANESATASLALGGGVPLMQYSGTNLLQFTAIASTNNGMLLTLAYPTGFTNRVDIFTCTNLVSAWWNLAVTTNVSVSTNYIQWLDTSPPGLRFYAAGNADVDTDSDGIPDDREEFMYHTDPNNPTSRPVSVSGTISYSGQYTTGTICVVAVTDSNSWDNRFSTTIQTQTVYTNSGIPNLTNYWFKAFRDSNSNSVFDPWEPWGWYTNASTYLTTNLTGINIVLKDPAPNVRGTITYGGRQTGAIWVVAVTNANSWFTNQAAALAQPASYVITNLLQTNYWIKAWRDSDNNGTTNAT